MTAICFLTVLEPGSLRSRWWQGLPAGLVGGGLCPPPPRTAVKQSDSGRAPLMTSSGLRYLFCKDCLQIRAHSEMLQVRTSIHEFGEDTTPPIAAGVERRAQGSEVICLSW